MLDASENSSRDGGGFARAVALAAIDGADVAGMDRSSAADTLGLNVCTAMLLCIGSKLQVRLPFRNLIGYAAVHQLCRFAGPPQPSDGLLCARSRWRRARLRPPLAPARLRAAADDAAHARRVPGGGGGGGRGGRAATCARGTGTAHGRGRHGRLASCAALRLHALIRAGQPRQLTVASCGGAHRWEPGEECSHRRCQLSHFPRLYLPLPRPPASHALRRHPRVCPIPRERAFQQCIRPMRLAAGPVFTSPAPHALLFLLLLLLWPQLMSDFDSVLPEHEVRRPPPWSLS